MQILEGDLLKRPKMIQKKRSKKGPSWAGGTFAERDAAKIGG